MKALSAAVSMNSPCPCGSGKKFKRCCGARTQQTAGEARLREYTQAALSFQARGDYPQAERMVDHALALESGDSGLWGIKGWLAYAQDRLDEADSVLEKALRLSPKDSRLHNIRGQVLMAQSKQLDAERAFGHALTIDPGFAEAWCNMATLQLQRHQPEEAERAIRRALALMPDDAELLVQLAKALYLKRDHGAAMAAMHRAQSLGANSVSTQFWLAMMTRAQGEIEAGQALEARACAQVSDARTLVDLFTELGRYATFAGRETDACYWLERAIALVPDHAGSFTELAAARKFSNADQALVETMEQVSHARSAAPLRGLEFALGKVWADLGDYDRSFQHYRAGNAVVRASVPFDRERYVSEFDHLIEFFSAERLNSLAPGSLSDLPVLIVGTPRSGTTLTEQIISSHSSVAGAGEMDYWPRLGKSLMEQYSEGLARDLSDNYIAHLRQHSSTALRVTDKMPGNFQNVGIIHAALPNAKIVHVRRHPIDACLSIYFQNFPDGHAYKWDMAGLALFYEQYLRIMAHWRAVLPPGTMIEVRYEDIVEDIEGSSRRMMDFLGLPWEAGQLDFYRQERSVFTASKWQARQPIYKTSKEKWRQYDKCLGPLLHLPALAGYQAGA
jgi:Tfp pilus assembly protein PilF